MNDSVENSSGELASEDERLAKWATEWATEKLRPMYEAYPDTGKIIPAFLFGIKYADDLEGVEVWVLSFMAAKAGLSGVRSKASAIKRGVALAPYVDLREKRNTMWEEALQTAIEELEADVDKLKKLGNSARAPHPQKDHPS